ncbi:MAG: methyltransferase domain-containing protein, partial [Hyphomonas sp.]
MGQITEDTLYQGRVTLFQPEKGFRASTDSLMLAAALPEKSGGAALEIGCGCGGALMTAAFRLSQMQVTGVDIDAVMTDLARQSVSSNNFKDRVSVETGNAADWVRDKENRF